MEEKNDPEWIYRDIYVSFTKNPYSSQVEYTNKVLDCLIEGRVGVLESPTGTGKTLSLLSAAVAWLRQKPGSRVYFSSRTHSQLAQAIGQLKAFPNPPSAVTLGSRDQMCVNPSVRSMPDKNLRCNALVKNNQCEYYHNTNLRNKNDPGKLANAPEAAFVHDIEDLVKSGQKSRQCPYYQARHKSDQADVVFLPYTYLLDSTIRHSLPTSLTNSLIIIDEAHNVTGVSEEVASFTFSVQEVALALREVDTAIKILEDESLCEDEPDFPRLEDTLLFKEILLRVEDVMSNYMTAAAKLKPDSTCPGNVLFEMFHEATLGYERKESFVKMADALINMIVAVKQHAAVTKGLTAMAKVVKLIFFEMNAELCINSLRENFKILCGKDGKLNVWCFNAALSLQSLLRLTPRAIVLTSGTLKPVENFIGELGLTDPVTYCGQHIIKPDQVLVKVVPKMNEVVLSSTFENRKSEKYLAHLGECLLRLMREVPSGCLVFFSSYPHLTSCIEHWKSADLWTRMSEQKGLFVEPKEGALFHSVIASYRNQCKRGAALFAVCRGKVAEGIDLSDEMARAVFILGLPFPNTYDPRVIAKRDHLNRKKNAVLNGSQWYSQEAFRAINQAIGRVLRHRHDFGAVYFLDKRFESVNSIEMLPDWTKKVLKVCSNVDDCVKESREFFARASGIALSRPGIGTDPRKVARPLGMSNEEAKVPLRPTKKMKFTVSKKNNAGSMILMYKAQSAIATLKEMLSKDDLKKFKNTLKEYRSGKDLDAFLKACSALDNFDRSKLTLISEFIDEDQKKRFDEFVFSGKL